VKRKAKGIATMYALPCGGHDEPAIFPSIPVEGRDDTVDTTRNIEDSRNWKEIKK